MITAEMTIEEAAREIHGNAAAHGWWDEDRSVDEVFALIHSEWSEALEAARRGEDLYWRDDERGGKPEGAATELIDGVIRIFDYLGRLGCAVRGTLGELAGALDKDDVADDLPGAVCDLHRATENVRVAACDDVSLMSLLLTVSAAAMAWVRLHGWDPVGIMDAKHEYNKTRPYKHGKRF